MNLASVALQTGTACGHAHLVEFYETEAFLVDTICDFLVPALRHGDTAVVVATTSHRRQFEGALREAGIDGAGAVNDGRYLAFDAAELLARFMVDGAPDPRGFHQLIDAVLDRAGLGGRRVRVYGEMVAVLLDQGDAVSALALEDLWNQLAAMRSFELLCAYPMRAFDDVASAATFRRICDQHTMVIPSESYSLLDDPAERSRAVAQLQQQAVALHPDHRLSPEARRAQAGDQRDQAGDQRDQAGDQRDQAGEQRDLAAEQRDQVAEQRDQAAEQSEASVRRGITTDPVDRSALARREAASDRRRASQDRRAGASERTKAELDRSTALADRGASARERENASVDDLTGVYLRGPGFMELEREMARAKRTHEPLVLAFVDVDGLKNINDSSGHAAGDRMLLEVANTLRAKMRSYDLIIRYGGDEFVCAMSGLAMADATRRAAVVGAALSAAPEHGSVTIGLAELLPGDSLAGLIARADAALYRQRKQQRSTGDRIVEV